jgi:hypothetical protein
MKLKLKDAKANLKTSFIFFFNVLIKLSLLNINIIANLMAAAYPNIFNDLRKINFKSNNICF